jgi:hypothetical protein
VPAFIIFWCISCMAFMRESIATVDPAPPMAMGAMPVVSRVDRFAAEVRATTNVA